MTSTGTPCRVKKSGPSATYTYSLHLCGAEWPRPPSAVPKPDAMTLRYSIRKNRYHSLIKLMMPTSGTFTITVNASGP